MYAVVKAGGKQHKVAVGDVLEVNRLEGDAGDAVSLPALLVVDGRTVISEAAALAKIAVTGEIVGHHKGPKIKILKYKNKTGYRKRIGHRQLLTELLVTDIDDGKPKQKAKADEKPAKAAKAESAKPTKAESTKAESTKADSTKAATATKADTDDKPTKTAKTSAKAAAKAATDDKPAKAAKATTAKASTAKASTAKAATAKAAPAKATKTAAKTGKATKSVKATKASAKASDTDEKKKD